MDLKIKFKAKLQSPIQTYRIENEERPCRVALQAGSDRLLINTVTCFCHWSLKWTDFVCMCPSHLFNCCCFFFPHWAAGLLMLLLLFFWNGKLDCYSAATSHLRMDGLMDRKSTWKSGPELKINKTLLQVIPRTREGIRGNWKCLPSGPGLSLYSKAHISLSLLYF